MRHLKLIAATRAGVLCLLGVAISAGWAAAATLTGMTVSTEGEETRVHVTIDGDIEVSHFTLSDPARLFVDMRGVDSVVPKTLPEGQGRAGAIEASVWNGDGHHAMTRVTIDLTRPSDAAVSKVDDGLMVVLTPQEGGQWTPEESLTEVEDDPVPSMAETAAESTPETTPAEDPMPALTGGTKETSTEVESETGNDEPQNLESAVESSTETPSTTMWDEFVETESASQDMDTAPERTQPEPAPVEESWDYTLPETPDYAGRRPTTVTKIGKSESKSLAGRAGPRVSLDIQGADIYTVLRSISEYSGVNIVVGYDVREKVTEPLSFHLESVPWGEALEMVLRSAHLWYREEGHILRVDTEENLRNEELARTNAARQMEDVLPLTTRIVEVVYANAREMKPAVEKALSRRGVIEVDERTNSILVTDIAARVEAAVDMIQHLDSQTPQVEIVAKMVDVDARHSRELGVLWESAYSSDNYTIDGPNGTKALVGANDVVEPGAQVRFGMVRSWGDVSATLQALERENKANIISNPRVTTVNNREARILVGKKIPLIVLDEAGNAVTQLVTIGITLLVTPHINDNNRITLDLHPEVSDLASQATVQGGVIINTSEADTRVMVENGQTAVIAGLIRSNDSSVERGVPILMNIPLIGSFFKNEAKIQEKRELLIFVTPRIITSFANSD